MSTQALRFQTCTFNPLDQLWSGIGGGDVDSDDMNADGTTTTTSTELLKRFMAVQVRLVAVSGHIMEADPL